MAVNRTPSLKLSRTLSNRRPLRSRRPQAKPLSWAIIKRSGGISFMIQGALLKQMRYIYGYSSETMCKKLKISKSYLSAIENNSKTGKQPSGDLINRYAEVFGIRPSALMLLSEEYSCNTAEKFARDLMIRYINKLGSDAINEQTYHHDKDV